MTGTARKREARCAKCGFWWHHPKEPLHFASWDEWAEEHPEKELVPVQGVTIQLPYQEGPVQSGDGPPGPLDSP